MPRRASHAFVVSAIAALLFAATAIAAPASAEAGSGLTRDLTDRGISTPRAGAPGSDQVRVVELAPDPGEGAAANAGGMSNRSKSGKHGKPLAIPTADATRVTTTNTGVSFLGLNHRDQRLADAGNAFSLEPPDQGLCVGNGYVVETINDVLRVWSTGGAALSAPMSLSTFYGYPVAIDRKTGAPGPFITDPSCYFDVDTHSWFHVILTLDVDPATGAFTGGNHLDIAVSTTPSPLGAWHFYSIHTEDDGTLGQPRHKDCPCIGDYPHIGADANGFYITTNEYPFFTDGFNSAQLYAMSKRALAAGAAHPRVTQLDKLKVGGGPGFTVWPAVAPAGMYATGQRGTEYFLSSMAAEESGNTTGASNRLGLWALTNTASLDRRDPDLDLESQVIGVETYAVPKPSAQKAGDFPLGQCINNTTDPTPFGPGCWQFIFVDEPGHHEVESKLDSNDSRMQQVVFANGILWGSLDTAVKVKGVEQAGIAYFAIRPSVGRDSSVNGDVVAQGYLAVAGNNLTYPAVAVLPNGKGVVAFTLVGKDYYPSAAYASIDVRGTGLVHVALAGVGPQDGFSGYPAFSDPPGSPARPRWGDYGAAVVDGTSIWMASEYIAQSCTLAQYEINTAASPFGSCTKTRTTLANWATGITHYVP